MRRSGRGGGDGDTGAGAPLSVQVLQRLLIFLADFIH